MQYVCDAGADTWFRIETLGEATLESRDMNHAVERYFRDAHEQAARSHRPAASLAAIEQSIGLKAHIQRTMPMFLTLRDKDGTALVTAMLPPTGQSERAFRPVIVGPSNGDPYVGHADAIKALARHYGMTLDASRCYPYKRA